MAYKIGDKAHGGIVFFVDSTGEHGMVAAESDQSSGANWNDAKKICSEIVLNGFDDWFLPQIEELILMYYFLHKENHGGFSGSLYWSATENSNRNHLAWHYDFHNGRKGDFLKSFNYHVRAARAF